VGEVYLIGIEPRPAGVAADAFLVATDALSYDRCAEWATEPTAVAMQVQTAPFAALFDVEPANHVHDEHRGTMAMFPRDDDEPCRTKVTLTWEAGQGFRAIAVPGGCIRSEPPRRVRVDADGVLASLPAAVATREP
jgi:hypothetical protein